MIYYRKKIFGSQNKKTVFVLCGWRTKIWHFYPLLFILKLHGYRSIIYEYDDDVLFSSISKTVENTLAIKKDILATIGELKQQGSDDISIFGTSYGSLISFMVANEEQAVSTVIANLTGADIAEAVWSWNSGEIKSVKTSIIDQGVTLEQLKKYWQVIDPKNNINNLTDRHILCYFAQKDEVIPYKLQKRFVNKLRNINKHVQVKINTRLNHMLAGFANLINYPTYILFLRKGTIGG